MKKIALLIGVSEYSPALKPLPSAIKDIEAVQRVLQDPSIGGFDHVKVLPNPNDGDARYEIENLFTTDLNKDDLVLLYFSGHGIKDSKNKLYFAASNTQKNLKGELVISTAVDATFIHELMNSSRAKRQVIILDCCFSVAFDPSLQSKDDGSVDFRQLGAEGRVVLTSSSSTQYSFEHKEANLSVYTHHLVQGIETGAADADGDGEISIAELHEYLTQKVQDDIPSISPKIIVLKDKGYEIVLANTLCRQEQDKKVLGTINQVNISNTAKLDLGEVKLDYRYDKDSIYYSPIPSLLLTVKPFIERLIEQLKSSFFSIKQFQAPAPVKIDENFALELIRRAADVDLVFVMGSQDGGTWILKAQSTLSNDINETDYIEIIKTRILSNVSVESIFTTGYNGIYRTYYDDKTSSSTCFVLIPLNSYEEARFIAVCGLSKESSYLNDAFTQTIISFYKATQNSTLNPLMVEAMILDDLKSTYGFLPMVLYNRRFELFCQRLDQIVIHFEPILDLKRVFIKGWEALARDPETLTAPVDLFNAAELWGRKFLLELDVTLLQLAAKSYRVALTEAGMKRSNDVRDLSVNVYPESLMRTRYFETVRAITTPDKTGYTLLPAENLILEISEKADLPLHHDNLGFKSPLQAFENRLLKYAHELEIRFGIDDFGVGYASVSRLAGLMPPFVKIDRDILHQQQCEVIIKFVREIVKKSSKLHITQVIVEGLDNESPIKLSQLNELGISYIQGHIVGKAASILYRLSKEKRQALTKLIRGTAKSIE